MCTNVYKYVEMELRNFLGLQFQEENPKAPQIWGISL